MKSGAKQCEKNGPTFIGLLLIYPTRVCALSVGSSHPASWASCVTVPRSSLGSEPRRTPADAPFSELLLGVVCRGLPGVTVSWAYGLLPFLSLARSTSDLPSVPRAGVTLGEGVK